MSEDLAEIGIVGAGVMGANLALNMADNGFPVAVHDSDPEKLAALAGRPRMRVCPTTADLVESLRPPRPIVLLVPAGDAVDSLVAALGPLTSAGDILIDAGNADFHDTRRRAAEAEAAGRCFLGIGVSGGAEGARRGPAIMAGGSPGVWSRVAPVFEKISAHYEDAPCAAWFGPDGAGHFVKTIHNGVEYADMQLIAEAYGVMRDGLGMAAQEISAVFERWNAGPLASYLMEISAMTARTIDPETGQPMLDVIEDRAGQKGTGRWSVIEAQSLGTPATVMEAAVAARAASSDKTGRVARAGDASQTTPFRAGDGDRIADLEQALIAGRIAAYAQGFEVLAAASTEYGWDLPLPRIAETWRAGCIIRSDMLTPMAAALKDGPDFTRSAPFSGMLAGAEGALRRTVSACALNALPAPALSAVLAWLDMRRTARSTANLIQAQRDAFGAHGFERTDKTGTGFHGPWTGDAG